MNVQQPIACVVCLSNHRLAEIKLFCEQNKLALRRSLSDSHDLQLIIHDTRSELYDRRLDTQITIDFMHGALGHRQQYGGGRGQAIAKAVGLKSGNTPSILDATAGLAGDAFILANLGCPITMLERSAILCLLISDAIEQASLNPRFENILNQGFDIIHQDANDYIEQQLDESSKPDVIYIDPMYPERKKSALVKKDMQILQRLHLDDEDDNQLLENALSYARKRVVVKRPVNAASLTSRKPNTSIKSKKTRYDVYTLEKM